MNKNRALFSYVLIVACGLMVPDAFAMESHGSGQQGATQGQGVLGSPDIDALITEAHAAQGYQSCHTAQVRCNGEECEDAKFELHTLQGIVSTFAKTFCGRSQNLEAQAGSEADDPVRAVIGATPGLYATPGGKSTTEALNSSHFSSMSSVKSTPGNPQWMENVINTYSLMISLQVQESNGNIVEGVDKSKSIDHSDLDKQETGLMQVSWDSQHFFQSGSSAPETVKRAYQSLLAYYINGIKNAADASAMDKLCGTSVFTAGGEKNPKGAVNPSELLNDLKGSLSSVEEGVQKLDPATFVKLNKACPSFSTEYTAMLARRTDAHNGPLNRGEIKPVDGCTSLLESVAEKLKSSERACLAFK